ncbi:MAG: uracil-DNA glycosylase [Clostridia bacterium]|nr:uracil-DNA glycosylase [Clostridia bacterium]MDY6185188.1 uracil-DNA glycosylase [Eubacteriales bacterium]
MQPLGNDWDEVIGDEFRKDYYLVLRAFLKEEYATRTVYPDMYRIFNALKSTPYSQVKAVILGQDPYHGAGQAHGLCFSVQPGVEPPPSLVNIFKELATDIGMPTPRGGCLQSWADQGVLLLNTTLTVRAGAPLSHRGHGWETFTDAVIKKLNDAPHPIVFLLWGGNARSKKSLITNPKHLILETVHPSPLSAYNGFFGCRHFSKCNAFLTKNGMTPIRWESVCEENR